MASFEHYIPLLHRLEGKLGLVTNYATDMGHLTNGGVTYTTFKSFFPDKNKNDFARMTEAEWSMIMRSYWDKCKADEIDNQSLAEIIVDWHINSGIKGVKGAQKAVGCNADGIVGPKTLSAWNSNPQCSFCKIKEARRVFYEDIVRATPSQIANLKGWLNRINAFQFEP